MNTATETLLAMLSYRRPEGSNAQRAFCERYLMPYMQPHTVGGYTNFIQIVGDTPPEIMFTAHHDTVHSQSGKQNVMIDKTLGHIFSNSDCLGADCTTGVWLILEMIKAGVPGAYVVFGGEEIGCQGSTAFVNDPPEWLDNIKYCISFDRYGTKSVITHQMGMRTASDKFAESFARAVNMDLVADDGGSYTDSNEFAGIVSECTNISVGYYHQHTKNEYQDLFFAEYLRKKLINADWSLLEYHRDPGDFNYEMDEDRYWWATNWNRLYADASTKDMTEEEKIMEIVCDHPEELVDLLRHWGYTAAGLAEDLGLTYTERKLM